VLVLGLLEVVDHWPGPTWALLGSAVGLLCGAAAWCFDEPAASVVDSSPRGLAWRAAARSPAALGLLAAWGLGLGRTDAGLGGRDGDVLLWGLVAIGVGAAWTLWRRSGGEPTPGTRLALVVIPAATAWALGQPLAPGLPVFPTAFAEATQWSASRTGWVTAGCLSVALLMAALLETRWWVVRPPPPRHGARTPWPGRCLPSRAQSRCRPSP
jgi:hypothetical protein